MQLNEWVQSVLSKSLAEVCGAKLAQEECLRSLAGIIYQGTDGPGGDVERLLSQYHTTVSALLLTSAPQHFSGYHGHCTHKNRWSQCGRVVLCYGFVNHNG